MNNSFIIVPKDNKLILIEEIDNNIFRSKITDTMNLTINTENKSIDLKCDSLYESMYIRYPDFEKIIDIYNEIKNKQTESTIK